MLIYNNLEKEMLSRLLSSHPSGLDAERLAEVKGGTAVVAVIDYFQKRGFVEGGTVVLGKDKAPELAYPIRLSSSGLDIARQVSA